MCKQKKRNQSKQEKEGFRKTLCEMIKTKQFAYKRLNEEKTETFYIKIIDIIHQEKKLNERSGKFNKKSTRQL